MHRLLDMAQRQLELIPNGNAAPDAGGRKKRGGAGGGAGKGGGRGKRGGGDDDGPPGPVDASLSEEAQRRYLNYAVSVITARALPDVRDGLKPVQRRVLYAMWANLHLYPDAKYRKCATIVGDVLGKFHPHGDTSTYEAIVRMAQDFSLRYRLVDGHGNFGSLDGDAPAAYRYTEARLAPLATELLEEIDRGTVDFRPNFDGTTQEPVVLPAKVPQLLCNGCTGIAVGMATNIPPHNLEEVCQAAVALIDDRKLETKDLLKFIKGPDFPTGGQITNSKKELREIYETGQGAIHTRGEWKTEETKRGTHIVVTSVPYGLSKGSLVEKIAEVIIEKKLPMLLDVRDESTADVRIVLELRPEADPALVMSYLYKHTPLETSFYANFTALVPTDNPEIAGPMRLDLRAMLEQFLEFREDVVTRRFKFELQELRRRTHILEGFQVIFEALDEAIRIIRKSDGKADAAVKLAGRFDLDDVQCEAILETKLYKLARLEIEAILEDLKAKRARAREIEAILRDKRKLWRVVRGELTDVGMRFSDRRRTKIGGAGGEDVAFDAEAYIVEEDATVLLSRDGWLKRQREVKDLAQTRMREGDAILAALRGGTKESLAIFSNLGSCYVMRVNDVPASTGYGEPLQKLFNFKDGERAVGAIMFHPTRQGPSGDPGLSKLGAPAGTLALALSKRGYGSRFNLDPHRELSTRAGRKFAKVKQGDEIVGVVAARPGDILCCVTATARALVCKADELPELGAPGRGVTVIKVGEGDQVMGFGLGGRKDKEVIIAEMDAGRPISIGPGEYTVTSRGGKGHAIKKRARVVRVTFPEPAPPPTLLN